MTAPTYAFVVVRNGFDEAKCRLISSMCIATRLNINYSQIRNCDRGVSFRS